MSSVLLIGLVISILLLLAWEDWKQRSVTIWSLAVYALLAWLVFRPYFQWAFLLVNTVFVIIQLLLVTVYFSFRKKQKNAVLGKMIGWGDVVFIILSALFLPTDYFLGSYLFGLIGTLLLVMITGAHQNPNYAIPLISGLALSQIGTVLWMFS
jgi:hypothetical protein